MLEFSPSHSLGFPNKPRHPKIIKSSANRMVKKANSKVSVSSESTKEPISQLVFPDFIAKTNLVCQTMLEDQILVIDVSD